MPRYQLCCCMSIVLVKAQERGSHLFLSPGTLSSLVWMFLLQPFQSPQSSKVHLFENTILPLRWHRRGCTVWGLYVSMDFMGFMNEVQPLRNVFQNFPCNITSRHTCFRSDQRLHKFW